MIKFKQKGDFKKSEKFFNWVVKREYIKFFHDVGEKGVKALQEATPKRTGKTAASWSYEVQDTKELSKVLITVLVKALKEKADELGADSIERLASTLLAVAVKDRRVIICHLGDGAIGAVTSEGSKVVSAPDNGEYANSTYFVTGQKASDHLKITKKAITDELGFFLMSDGTADYCYDDTSNAFRDGARKMALLAYDPNPHEVLEKTIVEKMIGDDTNSDDCSFVSLMFEDRYSYEGGAGSKASTGGSGLEGMAEEKESHHVHDRDISRSSVMGLKKDNAGDDRQKVVKDVKEVKDINSEIAERKKKKSVNSLIIILVASLVLVIALASAVLIKTGKDKAEESSEAESAIEESFEPTRDMPVVVPTEEDAGESAEAVEPEDTSVEGSSVEDSSVEEASTEDGPEQDSSLEDASTEESLEQDSSDTADVEDSADAAETQDSEGDTPEAYHPIQVAKPSRKLVPGQVGIQIY